MSPAKSKQSVIVSGVFLSADCRRFERGRLEWEKVKFTRLTCNGQTGGDKRRQNETIISGRIIPRSIVEDVSGYTWGTRCSRSLWVNRIIHSLQVTS